MHRRVAPRRPASAHPEKIRMGDIANIDLARSRTRSLDLGMASEAEIHVPLDQQLGIDGPVRVMADGAALPQRRMLEDKGPGLLPVALSAGFVLARHRQPAGGFEDVAPMRVVALDAIHLLLRHRVVLGKLEFRLLLTMALEQAAGSFPGLMMNLPLPPPLATCRLAGPWHDSHPSALPRGCPPGGFGRGRWLERRA